MSGASESDENDNESLFGGREPDGDVAQHQGIEEPSNSGSGAGSQFVRRHDCSGDSWAGVDPHAGISRERARTMERIVVEDERVRAATGTARSAAAGVGLQMGGNGHDEDSLGSGGDPDLTFQGFEERLFKVEGPAIPLLRSVRELWTPLSGHLGPTDLRPKRAMRIGVISPFFRRDADFFRQWQLPKGHESRAQATAALVSLLFAGTAMGLMSGKHEEITRNQQSQAKQDDQTSGEGGRHKPLSRVTRYTYIPTTNEQDSHPMFQIGLEELYSKDQTEVLALAVWLFVSAPHPNLDMLATHLPTHR